MVFLGLMPADEVLARVPEVVLSCGTGCGHGKFQIFLWCLSQKK